MEHKDVSAGPEASRDEIMKFTRQSDAPVEDERVPRDWAKLIRKLRWIGLEDEARRLQLAVRTLTPEEGCSSQLDGSAPIELKELSCRGPHRD
jgi:hypothetical protein